MSSHDFDEENTGATEQANQAAVAPVFFAIQGGLRQVGRTIFPLKNKRISQQKAFLAGLLLAASLCATTAAAAENDFDLRFPDVTEDTPYSQAILAAAEDGYVNGYMDGAFHPSDKLTTPMLMTICGRAFFPETMAENEETAPYPVYVEETMFQHRLMTKHQAKNERCTWFSSIELLLHAANGPIYSKAAWGDKTEMLNTIPFPQRAIISTARNYGLLDGLEVPQEQLNQPPTRGEFMQLLWNLLQKKGVFEKPSIGDGVSIIALDESIQPDELSPIYAALWKLPPHVLQAYKDDGWTIAITKEKSINELYPEYKNYPSVSGMTSQMDRQIILYREVTGISEQTILHEFGHFCHRNICPRIPEEVFESERGGLQASLRNYAASTNDEAFAEIFATICMYGPDSEKSNIVRRAAPKCYEHVYQNCFGETYTREGN